MVNVDGVSVQVLQDISLEKASTYNTVLRWAKPSYTDIKQFSATFV